VCSFASSRREIPTNWKARSLLIKKEHVGALLVISAPFIGSNPRIVSFATSSRLPAMYPYSESVDAGGLMSYGPSRPDLFRRAATYVDKILKGTKPADLLEGVHVAWRPAFAFQSCHFVLSQVPRFILCTGFIIAK